MRADYFRIKKTTTINYKLSILICCLNDRSEKLKALVDELQHQANKHVQILWLGDNKSMTVGEKRNTLMHIAKGDYFSYVDDDDFVSENYVKHALKAIESGKKVITFKGTQNTDDKIDCPFTYDVNSGRNHKKMTDGVRWKIMLPDHLCIWNRDFVTEKFYHKNLGEDHDWAKEMALKYTDKDVHHIDEFMYHYEYNRNTSQCRR